MNVTLGTNTAKEAYRKPFERELYTDKMLVKRAGELGISTKLSPQDPASEDAPMDLLASRIADFVHYRPAPGKREVQISPPSITPIAEAFASIVSPGGIWASHAVKDSKPLWIESDSPGLASLLSEHFATTDGEGKKVGCPIGRPADWVRDA